MNTFHDMGPGREEAMCNRQGVEHSDARDALDDPLTHDERQRLRTLLRRCEGYIRGHVSQEESRFHHGVRLLNDIIRELHMPNEEHIPWSLEGSEE